MFPVHTLTLGTLSTAYLVPQGGAGHPADPGTPGAQNYVPSHDGKREYSSDELATNTKEDKDVDIKSCRPGDDGDITR